MNNSTEDLIRSVAINIRSVREFRNYTQDYLAMKLGISQNAYSKIELAYTRITLERLVQIASILDVGVIDLLSRENEQLVQLNSSKIR